MRTVLETINRLLGLDQNSQQQDDTLAENPLSLSNLSPRKPTDEELIISELNGQLRTATKVELEEIHKVVLERAREVTQAMYNAIDEVLVDKKVLQTTVLFQLPSWEAPRNLKPSKWFLGRIDNKYEASSTLIDIATRFWFIRNAVEVVLKSR